MDITVNALATLVAKALGELPDLMSGGWSRGSGCGLADIVEAGLENNAREAVRSLPLSECSFLKDLMSVVHTQSAGGPKPLYSCVLPEDFLRLHTLWMPDWPRPLSDDYRGDPQRVAFGSNPPAWLSLRPSRPIVIILRKDTIGNAQLWFGPSGYNAPRRACYVPAPAYDSKTRTLTAMQPEAIPILIGKIVDEIRVSSE